MAERYLRDKLITGRIVFPPEVEGGSGFWNPVTYANDYYPKYITRCDVCRKVLLGEKVIMKDNILEFKEVTIYKQKSDFLNMPEVEVDKVLIEPVVNGWAVSFANLIIKIGNEKYVIHEKVLERQGITLSDEFYRLSDMYTLEEKAVAADPEKREFVKRSWKY